MIQFRDITLEDKELITKYTLPSNRRNCDLSFSNLCSWRFLYHTQIAEWKGFLLFKFWSEDRLLYMLPVGEGDIQPILKDLEADAKMEGEKLCIVGICKDMLDEVEQAIPGMFSFSTDRAYQDYIYLRADLATLSGKKFQSKRNHVNKFRKTYNYEYLPITSQNIGDCLRLEAEWCRENNCNEEDGTSAERRAVIFALTHFEDLGLEGGLICVEGKTVAFTLGMPINHNTFGIHVEKADTNIDGAYAVINQEFASRIPEQYTFINREEDLGIDGLRKAKLSYQPVEILEKYGAYPKKKEQ